MILTDKDIRERVIKENLIENFKEENLQSESYDLTLGNEISVLNRVPKFISIKNKNDIDELYETMELTEMGYSLNSGEYVLVKIKEKVNLPNNLTAHIRPRTRFTRLGLIVSDQHCNSTYSGILRIGIFNATNSTIKIYPDINFCQIIFEELKNIPSEEKQYKNKTNACYQNEETFRGAKFDDEFDKKVAEAIKYFLGEK